jgi:uncharacterized protein (DUF927 family)
VTTRNGGPLNVNGASGELATKYSLTGWEKGEATKAAVACFISWMNSFGCKGHREEQQLIEQVH